MFYLFGFLIMTMGVAISVKSNLGVSPVSSIPYTMTCVWGIEMGRATVLFHIVLVIIQILLLRKAFKIKNLLQVPVGVLFGSFTTLCNFLATFLPGTDNLIIQLLMMFFSTILVAIGIFMYVPADFVPLAGEGAMLAMSKITKLKFSSVKIAFDITMVIISFTVCLIALHSLGSVGIGTVMAAILVGFELKIITGQFGKSRDKILGKENATDVSKGSLQNIMKTDVYSLPNTASLLDALNLLTEKKISGAPVLDKNSKIVGFISDGDIMRHLSFEHSLFVNIDEIEKTDFNDKLRQMTNDSVMTIAHRHVITVEANDSLEQVCYILAENRLKKAPVMKNGNMIGIINSSNITKYIVGILHS